MADEADSNPYIDTSALAKRYLNESFSTELDSFLADFSWVSISTLTLVELHCLLARRLRNHDLTADLEKRVREALEEDVDLGYLRVLPVEDHHFLRATRLLDSLRGHALRTLDALHLSITQAAGHRVLATADPEMAVAAEDLGLRVQRFL